MKPIGLRIAGIFPYSLLLCGLSLCAAEPKPGPEDSITPITRVTKASDSENWLSRENLKKNSTIEVLGEILPGAGKNVVCTMKIYIRPAPLPPPPPPDKKLPKPKTPPPPPPEPKAKPYTFTVYSDDKAMTAYVKVLLNANCVSSMTLQGEFEDKDDNHKDVENWKGFKATKIVSTSITLQQARDIVAERDRKNAEIRKNIADATTGGVSGLDKNAKPKTDAPKKEDKKLVDEEK